jgi:hypothetical protein
MGFTVFMVLFVVLGCLTQAQRFGGLCHLVQAMGFTVFLVLFVVLGCLTQAQSFGGISYQWSNVADAFGERPELYHGGSTQYYHVPPPPPPPPPPPYKYDLAFDPGRIGVENDGWKYAPAPPLAAYNYDPNGFRAGPTERSL